MRIVLQLNPPCALDEARALTKKPTENAEAYRLYLLGRYHFAKFTRDGWTNATHYFEQALQIDNFFAELKRRLVYDLDRAGQIFKPLRYGDARNGLQDHAFCLRQVAA